MHPAVQDDPTSILIFLSRKVELLNCRAAESFGILFPWLIQISFADRLSAFFALIILFLECLLLFLGLLIISKERELWLQRG